MALGRKTKTKPVKAGQERHALVLALAESGEVVPSACGTCGAQVAADDPQAEQTYRQVGTYPYTRGTRSWRFHGVCSRATGGPELLALALDPGARPLVVTQAVYDVARTLGAPMAYRELESASHTDSGRGRGRFQHVKRAELDELRTAVERRHAELTIPVRHSSGLPCSICGVSHELVDRWGEYQHRPTCGACSELVTRAKIPGNESIEVYAFRASRHLLPARGVARFLPAHETAGYRLGPEERRKAWAYAADLPEAPLTDEEALAARMAELEERMAGAPA